MAAVGRLWEGYGKVMGRLWEGYGKVMGRLRGCYGMYAYVYLREFTYIYAYLDIYQPRRSNHVGPTTLVQPRRSIFFETPPPKLCTLYVYIYVHIYRTIVYGGRFSKNCFYVYFNSSKIILWKPTHSPRVGHVLDSLLDGLLDSLLDSLLGILDDPRSV